MNQGLKNHFFAFTNNNIPCVTLQVGSKTFSIDPQLETKSNQNMIERKAPPV